MLQVLVSFYYPFHGITAAKGLQENNTKTIVFKKIFIFLCKFVTVPLPESKQKRMNTNFRFFKNHLDAEARQFLGQDYSKVRLWPIPSEHAVDLGYRYADNVKLSDIYKEEIANRIYFMLCERFPDARSLVYKP